MQPQQLSYTPVSFHISDVSDDRSNNKYIGTIKTAKKDQLALDGGTATWLRQFLDASMKASDTTPAVSMHIIKLDVDVKQKGKAWQVSSSIDLAFHVSGRKIISYSGKSEGETAKSPETYITEFIAHTLAADFQRFDQWWAVNGGKVPTKSGAKVNVIIATTTDKPGNIIYNSAKPLSIPDFMGAPEESIVELAATYSGIMLGYEEKVENGEMVLDVTVTPYFDKSKSWFKPEGKTPAVLAHEQTHFDITAIKTCELANAIRNASLTRDTYASVIERLQRESTQATSDEEDKFDSETNHGIIKDKEVEWEKKIKQQIKSINCYK